MKDILITARRQKIEIIVYILCLFVSIGLNVYSITKYSTASWRELYTQLPYVIVISLGLYFLTLFVRLFVSIITRIFRKK